MALPVSFQLSYDLSSLVGPIARTALRLGSMAVLQDINRSGSDGITELQLAGIIGRHRIDNIMQENFRTIVGQSHQSIISQVLQAEKLILEAGAGPTVQQAITNPNPALLSMVIQISLLSFAHEEQSLAQAITTVSSEILNGAPNDGRQRLNYVSVLSAITACQQQTAQFPWASYFERAESEILDAVQNGQPRKRHAKKRRLDGTIRQETLASISDRSLPFVILKALLIHLVSVQDFPEHRNFHLATDTGSSTIVVWCYYVLGMSVNVQINGADVSFGDDVPRIFVKDCKPSQAFASVLDVAEETEPLFTLSQAERDPPLQGEDRTTARGFVRKLLTISGISKASMDERAHWIAAHCIDLLSSITQSSMAGPLKITSMTSQVENNVRASIAFLFDTAELGSDLITQAAEKIGHKEAKSASADRTKWAQIMVLIISFARVHNLESCTNLPLSLKAFWELQTKDLQISYDGNKFVGAVPDTFSCFDIISCLLLGYQYSQEYVANSALLSSWGWSVFFDSFDALDPGDIQPGMIHVKLGVPSRNGERKARIVDGPTDVPLVYGDVLDESEIPITFWPGIFAGKLSATLVGYYGNDAFSVVQIYGWEVDGKHQKWRLGFRGKQEMCLKFAVLSQCSCLDNLTDEEGKTWINKLIEEGLLERPGNLRGTEIVEIIPEYPPDKETFVSSPDKVFCTARKMPNMIDDCPRVWFFYATTNAAARWLALDGLDQLKGETAGFSGILRSKSCCVRCACRAIVSKSFVLL